MRNIIILTLIFLTAVNCGRKDNDKIINDTKNKTVDAIPIVQEAPKPSPPKIKLGTSENTLKGITYSSKDEIIFLKGFKEVGGMVLSGSTAKKKYSMSFFEKPDMKVALLEECYLGSNPYYKIIDRVAIKTNENSAWQYDPNNNICALIGEKQAGSKFPAERAWKVQIINGRFKINEINPAGVYLEKKFGASSLIYQE